MGREASDPDSEFPRALAALEDAVHDLLSGGWQEARRRRAYELAVVLAQASRAEGRKGPCGALDAIASLLCLSLPEVVPIRRALREKLLELLESLKDGSSAESA